MKKNILIPIVTIVILALQFNGYSQCPVPAPNVTVLSPICNYDNVPAITATIAPSWLEPTGRPTATIPVEFRVYDSSNGTIPIETNTTGLYTPTIMTNNSGLFDYWVSEYNPNVATGACEGLRTKVSIEVNKTLPLLISSVSDICYGSTNPTFVATDVIGTVEWFESVPPSPAVTGGIETSPIYVPSFTSVGLHTVYAVHKVNNCVSVAASSSYSILPKPSAPTVVGNVITEGQENTDLTATADAGAEINWYADAEGINLLQANSASYKPNESSVGIYSFYVTQEINSCQSSLVEVQYEIQETTPNPTEIASQTLSESIQILPNYSTGLVQIVGQTIIKTSVYSILGVSIIETNNKCIDISNWQSGVYFFSIETKNGMFTKQVLIK